MLRSLVGSEMCIRDSINAEYGKPGFCMAEPHPNRPVRVAPPSPLPHAGSRVKHSFKLPIPCVGAGRLGTGPPRMFGHVMEESSCGSPSEAGISLGRANSWEDLDLAPEDMQIDEPGFGSIDSVDNAVLVRAGFGCLSPGAPSIARHGMGRHSLFPTAGQCLSPSTNLTIDTSPPTLSQRIQQIKKRPSPPMTSPTAVKSSLAQKKKKRPAPLHLSDALSTRTPPTSEASVVPSQSTSVPALSTVNLNEMAFENMTCEGDTKWGGALQKGRRRYMEDTFRAIPNLGDHPRRGFYGIFDGHGGRKAADFAAEYLSEFATDCAESLEDLSLIHI
eukprot:TRINITY_DN2990_c0_g2_i13.p1 TRINITY_DN2990_c0_g2~~TRINITY_DN2990_c0_g2_i13.p1  ORF type:complete len:332 (+),score=37.67 TRINITY_DN2990_c0_g2_i13:92-1087(+)